MSRLTARALGNADPAQRWLDLSRMTESRGASPNEALIAQRLMKRLEEKHGKTALMRRVQALQPASRPRRHSPSPRPRHPPMPEWRRAGYASESWYEMRPQPNAPRGSGYHFRFNSGLVTSHQLFEAGMEIVYGFVPKRRLHVDEYTPTPEASVRLSVAETYGIEEEDRIAVWAAGKKEPKPTRAARAEAKRQDEEQRAQEEWEAEDDRKYRETKAKRARMSDHDLKAALIDEDILPHFPAPYVYRSGAPEWTAQITDHGWKAGEALRTLPLPAIRALDVALNHLVGIEVSLGASIILAGMASANQVRGMSLPDLLSLLTPHHRTARQNSQLYPPPAMLKKRSAGKGKPGLAAAYVKYASDWKSRPKLVARYKKGKPPPSR